MDTSIFQGLQLLTWPGAIALVGSFAVACTALYRFFKKEHHPTMKLHTDELVRLNSELDLIRSDLKTMHAHDVDIKGSMLEDKKAFFKTIERLEEKIEKVSDLIIEVIRAQNS